MKNTGFGSPFGMDGKTFGEPPKDVLPSRKGDTLGVLHVAEVAAGGDRREIEHLHALAVASRRSVEVVPAAPAQENTELSVAEEPSGTAEPEVAEVDGHDGEELVPFVNDNHAY
jgi:hypothetical protein